MAMQWLGLRFVSAAKNNSHRFPTQAQELASLIANHPPTFTGARGGQIALAFERRGANGPA